LAFPGNPPFTRNKTPTTSTRKELTYPFLIHAKIINPTTAKTPNCSPKPNTVHQEHRTLTNPPPKQKKPQRFPTAHPRRPTYHTPPEAVAFLGPMSDWRLRISVFCLVPPSAGRLEGGSLALHLRLRCRPCFKPEFALPEGSAPPAESGAHRPRRVVVLPTALTISSSSMYQATNASFSLFSRSWLALEGLCGHPPYPVL